MSTLVQLAKEMQDQFTVVTRRDGESIWVLKDGAPQWMTDVMHACHDDGASLPDDTVYDLTHDCVNAIAELDKDADADEARDAVSEIEPEHRTWQLFMWAAQWSEYVDEYVSNFGTAHLNSSSDLTDLFRAAQGLHIEHVGGLLIDALEGLASDDDDDDGPDEPGDLPKFPFNAHVRILKSTYYAGWTGRVLANNTRYSSGEWVYTVRLDDTGDEFDHGESNLEPV